MGKITDPAILKAMKAKREEAVAAAQELFAKAGGAHNAGAIVEALNARYGPKAPPPVVPRPAFVPKVKVGTVDAHVPREVCTESEIAALDGAE